MLLVLVYTAFVDPHLARYRLFGGLWRIDWRKLAQLWRLGAPIGATITIEIMVFSGSVFFMGLIGAPSLEGHAVVFQIISLAFMVPLGVSQAATVRVGHAYGARDRAARVARGLERAGDLPRLRGAVRRDDAAVSATADLGSSSTSRRPATPKSSNAPARFCGSPRCSRFSTARRRWRRACCAACMTRARRC